MRSALKVLWVGIGFMVSVSLLAACPFSVPIGQPSSFVMNMSGDLGTTVLIKFWSVGSMATANSGTCPISGMAVPYSTGFYLNTDWNCPGVVGCPCTGPSPVACGPRTAVLWSRANAGIGQYLISSVTFNAVSGTYDLDAISNGPGNILSPRAIPALTVYNVVQGPGTQTANVSWPALTNEQLKGYYDVAPAANIITGYAIRYWIGAGTPPSDTGSWTLCTNGVVNIGLAGTDPGFSMVTYPAPTGSDRAYLAISILFDSQTASVAGRGEALGFGETDFVGASSMPIGPTAAGLFTSEAARAARGVATVEWTTNVEGGVAYYEVFWARKRSGTYEAVPQTLTSPRGNSSMYTATFPKPAPKGPLFFKVKATMADCSEVWSDPAKLGSKGG